MRKNITILGATGSIGTNSLNIIREHLDKFKVIGLSGNLNINLLREQIKEFKPCYVSVGTDTHLETLKEEFPNIDIYHNSDGLKILGGLPENDILVTAVSGNIGIEATIAGINAGTRIALANKETLVCAGELINNLLKESTSEIIPVDSEHSALFQALQGNQNKEIRRLILTASGGPFRTRESLENVTVEEALKHPNWSMGNKISIDSATLVNKGLEVIEAYYLFNVPLEKIEVVVHPQSIIHSLIEYKDSSSIAQLGLPDMKVPILYALSYPERLENNLTPPLKLEEIANLTFEEPDNKKFKGLTLAYAALKRGGTAPLIYNTANEVAVELFLKKEIPFLGIYLVIEGAMESFPSETLNTFEKVLDYDKRLREYLKANYQKFIKN